VQESAKFDSVVSGPSDMIHFRKGYRGKKKEEETNEGFPGLGRDFVAPGNNINERKKMYMVHFSKSENF
jgi:hypothetical protein